MRDIENVDHAFSGRELGPVIPPGEALVHVEATKGDNGYYLISDGKYAGLSSPHPRPSFPHMQMVPADQSPAR